MGHLENSLTKTKILKITVTKSLVDKQDWGKEELYESKVKTFWCEDGVTDQ